MITQSSTAKHICKPSKTANNNILETHDYDSSGRAWTSGKAANGAIEKYTLNYVSGTETDVTDANGKVSKYYFDKSKGRNLLTKMEGVCSGGGSGSEVTQYFYDDNLNLTKNINALGHETTFTYDTNGKSSDAIWIRRCQSDEHRHQRGRRNNHFKIQRPRSDD